MTVSSTTSKVTYAGNGATTAFAVPFNFFQASDLQVIERIVATGAESTKALTTDYTVAGGSGGTGTVTAVSAPSSSVQWTIKRVLPRTQGMDLTPNDPFPANTVEESHDRAVMLVQELEEQLSRALKFPTTDSTALSANLPSSVERAAKFLAFDSAGTAIAAAGTSASLAPVSSFINTLLDDADAVTARATLGLGTLSTKNSVAISDLPNGMVVDRAYGEYTVNADLTSTIPYDDTIPQNTEGTQIISISITPKSTTNQVRISVSAWGSLVSNQDAIMAAVFVNAGSDAIAAHIGSTNVAAGLASVVAFSFEIVPGATSTQTYSLRVGSSGGTLRLNGTTTARRLGGASRAVMIAEELKA